MGSLRNEKVSVEVKRALAEIIRSDVHDDRLSDMTSIADVQVTGDLKFAKVYVSIYEKDERKRHLCVDALNHAAGFIRTKLSKKLSFRTVPQLTFILDDNISYSFEIDRKIKEVLGK